MKYCTKCGKELVDEAVVCTGCGCAVGSTPKSSASVNSTKKSLREAARIIMIVITVLTGFAIIPLCWMIPMTVYLNNRVKNDEEISLAFKICCLIFCGTVPGILLLLEDANI